MSDTITVTGFIATPPRHLTTSEGLPITSFRLASTQRRYDRGQGKWVDGETNWFTVTAFRQMATNAAGSLQKGDRVVATGRVRIRDWASGGRNGTTVEVEADAIGHDLFWGTTSFTRSIQSSLTRQEDQGDDALPDAIRQNESQSSQDSFGSGQWASSDDSSTGEQSGTEPNDSSSSDSDSDESSTADSTADSTSADSVTVPF